MIATRLFVAINDTYTGMRRGLDDAVRPVTAVGVVTLFAAENVLCVAAELTEPHDKTPFVSLSNACVDVGTEFGSVNL